MTPREFARSRAKALRAELTPAEKMAWKIVHDGELVALHWRKQVAIGPYVADLVSNAARLIVELDGAQHADTQRSNHDAQRTAWLKSQGYRVLRIWTIRTRLHDPDGVWRTIYTAAAATPARARVDRWRVSHLAQVAQTNASPLNGGGARSGGGGARSMVKAKPHEAHSSPLCMSPPQSSTSLGQLPPTGRSAAGDVRFRDRKRSRSGGAGRHLR